MYKMDASPEVINISSIGATSGATSGGGLELLMNDKRRVEPSISNIDKLEEELNINYTLYQILG